MPIWLEGAGAVLPCAPDRPALWLVDIDAAAARAETVALLPVDEAAFVGRGDARQRLTRRRLARLLLAAAAGVPVETVSIAATRLGAPIVEIPAGWRLSVAARWPACLIGVAREVIGVDLEVATAPLPDDLLTARERAAIASLPEGEQAMAGTTAWAKKEAHAKWTGRPRDLDPATVETSEVGYVSSPLGRSRCWSLRVGNVAVALCTGEP